MVTKLDRLARSVFDLANNVRFLEEKDVGLDVLDQGINTTTIYGKLQLNILGAIGEFERGLIRERSMEGRMRAIAKGVRFGVREKLCNEEIQEMVRLFETDELSKADIGEIFDISRSSVYRLYADYKETQRGAKSIAPAVVSTTPSATPPTTGTKPTTSPATRIGIVTTLVAKQPVCKSIKITIKKKVIVRIKPLPVLWLIRLRLSACKQGQVYTAVSFGQRAIDDLKASRELNS